MKPCCKKWKEAHSIGIFDDDALKEWADMEDITLCPECGSSLKEESKWCECEEPMNIDTLHNYCRVCDKPVMEPQPTPKLLEKLDEKPLFIDETEHSNYIKENRKTINQIIDYLHEK